MTTQTPFSPCRPLTKHMNNMKLTYEDCKELKDAGYEQKSPRYYEDGRLFDEAGLSHPSIPIEVYREEIAKTVYFPSLSELIEACGEESVITLTIGKAISTALHGATGLVSEGSSPEQAVKNLWIAINK